MENSTKEPTEVGVEPRPSAAKLIPNDYVTPEEKVILSELHKELFAIVDEDTVIKKAGPLVMDFN